MKQLERQGDELAAKAKSLLSGAQSALDKAAGWINSHRPGGGDGAGTRREQADGGLKGARLTAAEDRKAGAAKNGGGEEGSKLHGGDGDGKHGGDTDGSGTRGQAMKNTGVKVVAGGEGGDVEKKELGDGEAKEAEEGKREVKAKEPSRGEGDGEGDGAGEAAGAEKDGIDGVKGSDGREEEEEEEDGGNGEEEEGEEEDDKAMAEEPELKVRGPRMVAAPKEGEFYRPWDAKKVAIVVMAYSHDTSQDLAHTLDVLRSLGKADQHDIIVSQEHEDSRLNSLVVQLQSKGTIFKHITHQGPDIKGMQMRERTALHQKLAMDAVFSADQSYTHAIFLEDSVELAPDTLDMFAEATPIMDKDPTVWCISAYNGLAFDNMEGSPSRLMRSSHFSGVVWMLRRELWTELSPAWPKLSWVEWMQSGGAREGRSCIIPEVSRAKRVGNSVYSRDEAVYEQFNRRIRLAELPLDHNTFGDMSYLVREEYDAVIVENVKKARLVDNIHSEVAPSACSVSPSPSSPTSLSLSFSTSLSLSLSHTHRLDFSLRYFLESHKCHKCWLARTLNVVELTPHSHTQSTLTPPLSCGIADTIQFLRTLLGALLWCHL